MVVCVCIYIYISGEDNGTPLQCSCLENPVDGEPGRLQSMGSLRVGRDWASSLSLFTFHALEKEMATHSSVLAWRIPETGEPRGLPSMGLHGVRHDWSDLAAAAAAAVYISMLLSQFVPPSPSLTVSTCPFSMSVSISALKIGSSIPFF